MDMKERLQELAEAAGKRISESEGLEKLNEVRVAYLGKKGELTAILKSMKDVAPEERPKVGQLVNETRSKIEALLDESKQKLEEAAREEKMKQEVIDVTLPAKKAKIGHRHPNTIALEEVERIFIGMGYEVVEGPEVEYADYNFTKLNIPENHPARDAQDTFYVEDDKLLLRSQTSPVQARVMLANKGEKPIRMICPGKTYRRDDDDATHSHQFMQIEGLLIDEKVSLSDLKGTFDVIAKKLFGEDCKTRFRPSYYPFTEPSVETDISCFNCHGKGCPICKNTGWITVAGAGMVNPKVLEDCGYDPKKWQGFAFGFGAERLAMLKYGINDIRAFYNTDLRELKNFDRRTGE